MICRYCNEEIVPGEPLAPLENIEMHHACGMRLIIGSRAHVARLCSCYVPGSEDSDPPGMTRRQAAEAAFTLWRQLHP